MPDYSNVEPSTVREIADQAIGLFLEYRDDYGYTEEVARIRAVDEVEEGVGADLPSEGADDAQA